jgi:hypothetical protein
MRFEPHPYDEERKATALRAFFVTLLFSLSALWAFGGVTAPAHGQGGLTRQPFEQGAKLAGAENQRALAAKAERAKPRAHLALDLSSPAILAASVATSAPTFLGMASWISHGLSGSGFEAHHYFATGPPGRQLS